MSKSAALSLLLSALALAVQRSIDVKGVVSERSTCTRAKRGSVSHVACFGKRQAVRLCCMLLAYQTPSTDSGCSSIARLKISHAMTGLDVAIKAGVILLHRDVTTVPLTMPLTRC